MSKVSEKAVEAALQAYFGAERWHFGMTAELADDAEKQMRRALEASLPHIGAPEGYVLVPKEQFWDQRVKPGVRAVITTLHRRAEEMNHYPAKQWLNSLAFELGWRLKRREGIEIADSVDASLAALPSPLREVE